jgi:hypothetical protein
MNSFVLKYWQLFAIALVLIAIVGLSQYAEFSKQRYDERAKQTKATAVAKGEDGEAKDNAPQPYKPPVWAKYVTFPEGVGAWAVILTLFVIAWQSIETRDAARAAVVSAQALINSERALLLFTVDKVAKDEYNDFFVVKVKNYGRVPARTIEISSPIQASMSIKDLIAESPDYGEHIQDIQEYLAPQESWTVATIFPQRTKLEKFYDKTYPAPISGLITYGQVTYLDGMSTEVRHSRYCIALDVDDLYRPISVVGSEEYLECT